MSKTGMKQFKDDSRYVICINNDNDEDLVQGKVYRVLDDDKAAQLDYIRVVDESGEDYLYPSTYFVGINLPQAAARALFSSSSPSVP
jgi:hypothetical protein